MLLKYLNQRWHWWSYRCLSEWYTIQFHAWINYCLLLCGIRHKMDSQLAHKQLKMDKSTCAIKYSSSNHWSKKWNASIIWLIKMQTFYDIKHLPQHFFIIMNQTKLFFYTNVYTQSSNVIVCCFDWFRVIN